MICTFFGHRVISYDIKSVLYDEIEKQIKAGCDTFLIGNYGKFDDLAFDLCLYFKQKKYPDIKILLVSTHISRQIKYGQTIKQIKHDPQYMIKRDFETITYPIEDEFYLNKITATNKYMIDDSAVVICFVDKNQTKSGAKRAMNYAKKKNKTVINIFNKCTNPFSKYSWEDREKLLKQYISDN